MEVNRLSKGRGEEGCDVNRGKGWGQAFSVICFLGAFSLKDLCF